MKNVDVISLVMDEEQGIKCAILEDVSTTTRMESLSWEQGKKVMKSTEMLFQGPWVLEEDVTIHMANVVEFLLEHKYHKTEQKPQLISEERATNKYDLQTLFSL